MFSNPEINNNTNNFLKYVNNNDNNDNNILYTELKVFELNLEDKEDYYSDEDIAKYK